MNFVVFLRELDPGLQEAVSTLIWAAPRLQSEVSELKIVSVIVDCDSWRTVLVKHLSVMITTKNSA